MINWKQIQQESVRLRARLALADKLAEAVEIYFDNRPSGADCSIPVNRRKNAQSALAAYRASAEVAA